MTLTVGALWRYPVKTLAGERLDTAELTTNGIVGDRTVHVRGPEGVRTSRRHHNLLGLHATLRPNIVIDGAVLKDIIARFDGKLARNAAVLRPGTIRVGDPVQLVRPTD